MSMVPGEQRVLAVMERELRRSDPELVAMLEEFGPPRRHDFVYQLSWPLRRLPRGLVVTVLLTVVLGLGVMAGLLAGTDRQPAVVPCARPATATGTCPAVGQYPPGGCPAGNRPPHGAPPAGPSAPAAGPSYAPAAPAAGPPGDGGGWSACAG